MNRIGDFIDEILLIDGQLFLFIQRTTDIKGRIKGKWKGKTSVVLVNVFYTITPEMFLTTFSRPDA